MEPGKRLSEAGLGRTPELTDEEWEKMTKRLTLHAVRKLMPLVWRGVRGSNGGHAPGGAEAADFAAEAIVDTLEGRRTWNREAQPDFFEFLKGVVDSKVNHLANSQENRRARRIEHDGAGDPLAHLVPDKRRSPHVSLEEKDGAERFRAAVLKEIRDDDVAVRILECLEAEITKPSEMAVLLECEVAEVNNAQKRLRRGVTRAMSELKPRSGRR